jgi:hypothetical protein
MRTTFVKEREHMQGFGIPLEQYQPVFSLATDTASPNQPIPREVARLLGLVNDGIMTLREAADFANREEV